MGALIGWITNKIAIRLIFRPINPVVIPLLNIRIQGVLPSRKHEIAKSIGEIVESELVSLSELVDIYTTRENIDEIKVKIGLGIREVLDRRLSLTIAAPFKKPIINFVDSIVSKESGEFTTKLIADFVREVPEKFSLSKSVEDKINSFDMRHLEQLIVSIAGRELKHIEALGAILGLAIGLLQGLIVVLLP